MAQKAVMTSFVDILEVARKRRISPCGVLPNCWEPDGYTAKGRGWGPEHVAQVDACRRFLRSPECPKCRRAQSSYFLKHEVERERKAAGDHVYVTNGAFIIACWLEGLKPRRARSAASSPNAMIVLPTYHPSFAA